MAGFGAPFLINIISENRDWKFDLHAREAMYLGPDPRSKDTHSFYVPSSKAIVRSRDYKALATIPDAWNKIKVKQELRITDQLDNTKPWLQLQEGILYWDINWEETQESYPLDVNNNDTISLEINNGNHSKMIPKQNSK